jgi:hypothetical protein
VASLEIEIVVNRFSFGDCHARDDDVDLSEAAGRGDPV